VTEKKHQWTIYPAIDLLGGQCVRLNRGRYDQVTVYHKDPLVIARRFKDAGAEWIHVVDLDAARSGVEVHETLIARIRKETGLKVQTGGGVRDLKRIDRLLGKQGLDRVVLGTAAVMNPDLTEQALAHYGERIAIGIDARDGMVQVQGWTQNSQLEAVAFARLMAQKGAKTVIYTDIQRDGTLRGPALDGIRKMVDIHPLNIIASGGIGRQEDIDAVRKTGAAGVIIGKAIYEGKVVLEKCWQKE
jgi:phosphoribosylformimino-5-aminoimidazole carboxamide ribotide isomerase